MSAISQILSSLLEWGFPWASMIRPSPFRAAPRLPRSGFTLAETSRSSPCRVSLRVILSSQYRESSISREATRAAFSRGITSPSLIPSTITAFRPSQAFTIRGSPAPPPGGRSTAPRLKIAAARMAERLFLMSRISYQ